MKLNHSKPKVSFYRRLLLAHLIDTGVNTVPLLVKSTGMPKRTIQDAINALADLDIKCVFTGANKNGNYSILSWGAINQSYIENNLKEVKSILQLAID